jgi:hypothetical protein
MSYQDRDHYHRDRMSEDRQRSGEQGSAYGRDYGYTRGDWDFVRNRSLYGQRYGSQADYARGYNGYDPERDMSGRSGFSG